MEATGRQIDTILTFLGAYPAHLVKEALKRRNAHLRGERKDAGWRIFAGSGEPDLTQPGDVDWMKIEGRWYYRPRKDRPAPPSPEAVSSGAAAGHPKTDLSMKPTDRPCPLCGEVMAWEPICPGCALGRMGFAGRYVCMDDMTHEFYVTKPGVELPNR